MIRIPVRRIAYRLALVLAMCLGASAAGLAATPVEISGDQLQVLEADSKAVFSGNVVVTQGTMRLTATRVVILYGAAGPGDIDSFEATGGVRIATPDQKATGERAVYDPDRRILTLSGNVVVTNATGTVTGPALVLDLAAGTTTFTSGGSGRVTGVFTPQE